MQLSDPQKYENYLRMTADQFKAFLLQLIGPSLQKDERFRADVLSPAERLTITLRYLAIGDHMISMSYLHRIGKSTVSNVIRETCNQLWLCLKNVVLRQPTQQQWLKIENDFEQQWQFPNCIGALDGKRCHFGLKIENDFEPPHGKRCHFGSTTFGFLILQLQRCTQYSFDQLQRCTQYSFDDYM
ncbi:hypothetical protein QE152_g4138 [Popillia japonica]|uniref:Transposase n=1 Tax=Popillia japonica TaxID=7064 RepID=A0AAW1N3V8_POPJA